VLTEVDDRGCHLVGYFSKVPRGVHRPRCLARMAVLVRACGAEHALVAGRRSGHRTSTTCRASWSCRPTSARVMATC
jgi:hypothetical protein